MLSSFINKGNTVKLAFSSNPERYLDATIEEVTEEGMLVAIGKTEEINVPAGDEAICKFASADVPYSFVTIFSSFDQKPGYFYLKKPRVIFREESRIHNRFKANISVLINESIPGRIINLSMGGALIETDEGIDEESLSTIRFELDNEIVETCGSIVRKESGNKFGIKFSFMESAGPLLENYLLKNEAKDKKRLWGETFIQYNLGESSTKSDDKGKG